MSDSLPGADFLEGAAVPIEGDAIEVRDPADPASVVWRGSPRPAHVDAAVASARAAFPAWSRLPFDERAAILKRYAEATQRRLEPIARRITLEMGKTLEESRLEAKLLADKVAVTLADETLRRVRGYEVAISASRTGTCRFRPHGVMAVLGPFNFPAHLPNGHLVPALLMGNTVVFKPSDKAPGVAQLLAECLAQAGLPKGVFSVVQGGAETARRLVAHDGIDGILFTGSVPAGRAILEANLARTGRIVALEMGGSNAAAVMPSADLRQAVVECARAAFATTGQRCTCTRRILVHREIADRFIPAFCHVASNLIVGPGLSKEPVFMGPVVNEAAAEATLAEQARLARTGGRVLVAATRLDRPGSFVTPSVVEVDRFRREEDRETFGPLVRLAIVDGLDDAIAQADATDFGLAAAIFTRDDAEWEAFASTVRAGCVNRNNGTAGASGKLPFGGLGASGNHRPAGAFAIDSCAWPLASLVERSDAAAVPAGMLVRDEWVA
jgi:succinylglutamic semialdehyde dehydrogenase